MTGMAHGQRRVGEREGELMSLRYVWVFGAAVLLAAAALSVGLFAAAPDRAEASNTVTVRGCTGTNVTLEAREKRMLDLHNQKRGAMGLPRLCVHPALQRAANYYSQDMVRDDYFRPDTHRTYVGAYAGETFSKRIARFGYRFRVAGENIACGSGSYATPDNRFSAWMNSPGHRANILNRQFREVGIGAVTGTHTCGGKRLSGVAVWTVDLGAR
jgi:uncharacterized protein YkwD